MRIRKGLIFFLFLLAAIPASAQTSQKKKSKAYLTRFANECLKDAELVAEIHVNRVYRMGMGVDVVKVKVKNVLFNILPKPLKDHKEQLILANTKEFTKGTDLLLVLKRYQGGDRLSVVHRLSILDGNYAAKVRLIKKYLKIEFLPKKDKLNTLMVTLMKNLKDESVWIQWNSIKELSHVLDKKLWEFTTGDVEYLERLASDTEKPDLKNSILRIRDTMASNAKKGPSILNKYKEKTPQNQKRR